MKYLVICTAMSALSLSGCSASLDTILNTSKHRKNSQQNIQEFFPGMGNSPVTPTPVRYYRDVSKTSVTPVKHAGHDLPSRIAKILSEKHMIETADINNSFAPLYDSYGVHSGIIEAHSSLLFERRRYADVMELVEGAWKHGATLTSDIYNIAGMAGFANREAPRALRLFNEALRLQPKNTKTVNNIAVLYLSQNRTADALKTLSAIPVRTVSDRVRARHLSYNKALAYAMSGNIAESEHLLRMTMRPDEIKPHIQYFQALRQQPGTHTFSIDRVAGLLPGRYNKPGNISFSTTAPIQLAHNPSAIVSTAMPVSSASGSFTQATTPVNEIYEQTASYGVSNTFKQVSWNTPMSSTAKQPTYKPQPYVTPAEKDPLHIFDADVFYTPSDKSTNNDVQAVTAEPFPVYQDPEPVHIYSAPTLNKEPALPSYEEVHTEPSPPSPETTAYFSKESAGFVLPNPMPHALDTRNAREEKEEFYDDFYKNNTDKYHDFRGRSIHEIPTSRQGSVVDPLHSKRKKKVATAPKTDSSAVFDDGQLAAFAEAFTSPAADSQESADIAEHHDNFFEEYTSDERHIGTF